MVGDADGVLEIVARLSPAQAWHGLLRLRGVHAFSLYLVQHASGGSLLAQHAVNLVLYAIGCALVAVCAERLSGSRALSNTSSLTSIHIKPDFRQPDGQRDAVSVDG
jgi:hypothetical protein